MTSNDTILLKKFKSGCPRAFKSIFDANYKSVVTWMVAKNKSKKYVPVWFFEEIAIICFERIYKERDRFESLIHIRRFLFFACKNLLIDRYRASQKTKKVLIDEEPDDQMTSEEQSDLVTRDYIRDSLLKAVCHLHPQRREVIYLLFFKQLSTGEVAMKLNLSKQTVRNVKIKAITILKDQLGFCKHLFSTV